MRPETYENEPFFRLYHENLRLLLFGGKGGVGKTTIAAAFSLYISDKHPQKRFLIISTDPAHSLSDSFDYPLDSVAKPVYGRNNLFGLELDAQKLFDRFKTENSQKLKKILLRGTYLDEEDTSRLLELSFPGIDEVMALIEIVDLLKLNRPKSDSDSDSDSDLISAYDLIIVDTAPTGHTLRLLELPQLMEAWIGFLNTLMAKHRYLFRVYSPTKSYKPDDADHLIEKLSADIQRIKKVLQNQERCRFVPIATPEPVVLAETERMISALAKKEILVKDIFINQVMLNAGKCEICSATSEIQNFQLEAFRRRWADLDPNIHISLLPASQTEVKGEGRLRSFVEASKRAQPSVSHLPQVQVKPPSPSLHLQERESAGTETLRRSVFTSLPVPIPAPDANVELFFFCGKGGVGKTTFACAFAIQLSRRFPDKKILLFSTDPAHSLSDCLGEKIGNQETQVESLKNLFAVEIDPESLFKEFKSSYARQIQELFNQSDQSESIPASGVAVQFDRKVITSLLDLAPPGLDEIMALSKLADYVDQKSYDLYVIDAAPTGHALRFLELPSLMRQWLRVFFEIILKYRSVVRLLETSEVLVEISKKLKQVQQLLADPKRCDCIPVSLATEMSLKETQRLTSDLSRLKLPFHRIILNRMHTLMGKDCSYCASMASDHKSMLVNFKRVFQVLGLEIVSIPQWVGTIGAPLSSAQNLEALSKLIEFEG